MALFNLFSKRDDSSQDEVIEDTDTQANDSESTEDILLTNWLKGSTKITKQTALSIPAVNSAVDRISNLVAMLPIKLYKIENDNGKEKISEVLDDDRTKILNQDTGDTLDSFQLKKEIARDYLLEKGSYVYIEKKFNEYKSLRHVKPENISILKNSDPIFKDIKYSINGNEYETYEFLTILRNTDDGATGKSVVDEISKCLDTAITTIAYELGIVRKGGGKKGFLTSVKRLGKNEITELKKAWKNYYSNDEENIIILNNGLEFKEGTNSSVELQMNERKKTLKDDINDVFHISSSYDDTVKDGVMPIISAIESALNRNFLLEDEKGNFYFAFDTKKITRGSLKDRYEAYKIATDTGIKSINEVRKEEDLEPINDFNVLKLSLGNVLYNIDTKEIYTPNTDSVIDTSKKAEGGDKDENRS